MAKAAPKITEALGGIVQFRIGDRYANEMSTVQVHEREYLPLEARLAVQLLERFGLVAAQPNGEDSAGRQAGALMPPQEAVNRSVEMATLMVNALRERNLIATIPSLLPLED